MLFDRKSQGGIIMENEKREVIEELSSTYKKKKKLINILLEESIKLGYNIYYSKQNINEFYNKYFNVNIQKWY